MSSFTDSNPYTRQSGAFWRNAAQHQSGKVYATQQEIRAELAKNPRATIVYMSPAGLRVEKWTDGEHLGPLANPAQTT